MVQLTCVRCGQMRTFGWRMHPFRPTYHHKPKPKLWNHRVPIQYKKFMQHLDPEEVVAHYSRDDITQLDPRAGRRTYKDAQQSMGRKVFLLKDLSDQELELNNIFQKELERQRAMTARIEKIRVLIDSQPGRDTELIMNKNLSTPFDCAKHIHELLTTRSVVAEVESLEADEQLITEGQDTRQISDGTNDNDAAIASRTTDVRRTSSYWDLHKPLISDCRLKFRHFTDQNLNEINRIYWRSCSLVLGMAIRHAFKDDIKVLLHSWPKPNLKSGSFVYDTAINLKETWEPTEQELRAFTKLMWEIKSQEFPFERLQVNREMAQQLFKYNPFKLVQIDSMLQNESSQGKVTVYRCGGLMDLSVGPMISNTSQIGRISLASVHPFPSKSGEGTFYRFQGVSVPQQLPLSSYLYQHIILEQAKQLNTLAM